mmetsp:Transcript_69530/g.226048  ORF Transcript_69530/g.226048 Transcript_69530/m.226048 type:complete len:206 (-) Transcript_69530:2488-3105(-)
MLAEWLWKLAVRTKCHAHSAPACARGSSRFQHVPLEAGRRCSHGAVWWPQSLRPPPRHLRRRRRRRHRRRRRQRQAAPCRTLDAFRRPPVVLRRPRLRQAAQSEAPHPPAPGRSWPMLLPPEVAKRRPHPAWPPGLLLENHRRHRRPFRAVPLASEPSTPVTVAPSSCRLWGERANKAAPQAMLQSPHPSAPLRNERTTELPTAA